MNSKDYRNAFNSVKFRGNFEQDTINYLIQSAHSKKQKEKNDMKTHKFLRAPAIAAALVAILSISTFAIWTLLSPKEVANQAGDIALAKAFDSENAVAINQAEQTGDYTITLGGIVNGKELSDFCEDVQEDRSYIVASVAYTDGRKITAAEETGITFTPLVSGYKPWQVNAWTLNGGYSSFVYEGVNYYIFECSNIEIFADHTVYLAAYEGNAPSADIFTIDQDGVISFAEGFHAPHALFTLPLDSSKADLNAVHNLLESNGIITE